LNIKYYNKLDNKNISDRFFTGDFGEYVVGKYFNINIMDPTAGSTNMYNIPDLSKLGYNIGVKTSDYFKNTVITIPKYGILYPQIVVIKYGNIGFIAGLATNDILNKYSSDEYILNKDMVHKKTGFYGYQYLSPITKLNDIIKIIGN
jgi:hypothetical protein